MSLNETHDPARVSWVESAQSSGFPIQHLPYGVFEASQAAHVGVAIGDMILDLTVLEAEAVLRPGGEARVFDQGVLNPLMALPQAVWAETRAAIADLLDAGNPRLRDDANLRARALVPHAGARMRMPFAVAGFTDFYASKAHATNVGSMFRDPENALMPNWLHIPIGYNGRASTVVVSGTEVRRPLGQLKGPEDAAPRVGPSAKLDIELELGAVVGTPSLMGEPLSTASAYNAIFGYVLLNDWSARDIQVWEYQPLGPFQSKAFATSISPWVVTREALEPFRVDPPARDVPLLPYLAEATPNGFDIALEVALEPDGAGENVVARTNARELYYTAAQQLAHHSLSGCAMRTGDLLGSGTISGETPGAYGSFLELSWNGTKLLAVAGQTRSFLEDGDRVVLRGEARGAYRVSFGECAGTIRPAPDLPQD